jgi:hypothetical protein
MSQSSAAQPMLSVNCFLGELVQEKLDRRTDFLRRFIKEMGRISERLAREEVSRTYKGYIVSLLELLDRGEWPLMHQMCCAAMVT